MDFLIKVQGDEKGILISDKLPAQIVRKLIPYIILVGKGKPDIAILCCNSSAEHNEYPEYLSSLLCKLN